MADVLLPLFRAIHERRLESKRREALRKAKALDSTANRLGSILSQRWEDKVDRALHQLQTPVIQPFEVMRIDAKGGLNIGATAPSAYFDVGKA